MESYLDASHATWFHTVQGLYPGRRDDPPMWHAVFFADSKMEAIKSMAWALDSSIYDHLLDLRVCQPTLDRPAPGNPWDPPTDRARRALKAAREARATALRVEAAAASSRAADPRSASATTKARAADRFRSAVRR